MNAADEDSIPLYVNDEDLPTTNTDAGTQLNDI